jgi:hypothetical protein
MPPLLRYLLELRFRALFRSLRYLVQRDPFGLLLAVGGIIAIVVFISKNVHRPPMILIVLALHSGVVQVIHTLRKDAPFLVSLGIAPRVVFLWEYCILALPSMVLLVFTAYPITIFAPILISCVFAVLPPFAASALPSGRTNTGLVWLDSAWRQVLMRLIPPLAFEWWGGLRQRGGMIFVLWTGALLLAWQPFLLSVCLFFLIITPIEFYGMGEHRSMAKALYQSPTQFLLLKIKHGFRCYALLLTPPVALGMALNIRQNLASNGLDGIWEQMLIFAGALATVMLVSALLATLCVLAKYSFYIEGLPFMFAVSSVIVLTLATLWHPYISVIGLGVSFSFLIPKATKRLRIEFS